MPMKEIMAERELIGESAARGRFPVRVRIGKPYPASNVDWACPVGVERMEWRFPGMHGVDSLQALTLALYLARQSPEDFIEKGGKLFWADGEPATLESILGKGV
jgi:hypothetical protein